MAPAQITMVGALLRPFDDDDDPLQNAASTNASIERRRALEIVEKTPKIGAQKVREFLEKNVVQKGGASPDPIDFFLSNLFSHDRFYSHGETSFPPLGSNLNDE